MRKIICDRCGKDITSQDRIGYISINWRSAKDGSLVTDNKYEDADFCEACMKSIVAVVDLRTPEKEADVGPDPKENEETLDDLEDTAEVGEAGPIRREKKRVDLKELRELVKAGKTPQEIADHFGITLKQYQYQRRKAEQLYIDGRL